MKVLSTPLNGRIKDSTLEGGVRLRRTGDVCSLLLTYDRISMVKGVKEKAGRYTRPAYTHHHESFTRTEFNSRRGTIFACSAVTCERLSNSKTTPLRRFQLEAPTLSHETKPFLISHLWQSTCFFVGPTHNSPVEQTDRDLDRITALNLIMYILSSFLGLYAWFISR